MKMDVGTPVLLEFGTSRERVKSVYVGSVKKQHALFSVPLTTGIKAKAREGNRVTARYMHNGTIYGFQSAVADFRPQKVAEQKIKKHGHSEGLILELGRNPDILATVAEQKKVGHGPLVTVGFAAETEDLLANAQGKLERKRLDMIVANDVSAADAGFAVDTNRVTLLTKDGTATELPLMSKDEVAEAIFDAILGLS